MILTVSWPEKKNSLKIFDLAESKQFVFSEEYSNFLNIEGASLRNVAEFDFRLNEIRKTFFDEFFIIDSKIKFLFFKRIIWEFNLENIDDIMVTIRGISKH